MTKDIVPQGKRGYGEYKNYNYEIADEEYIDKGNLTSRECGRLVKGMVEQYERKMRYKY